MRTMNAKLIMVTAIIAVVMSMGCGDLYPANPSQSAWVSKSEIKSETRSYSKPKPASTRKTIPIDFARVDGFREINYHLKYKSPDGRFELKYNDEQRRHAYAKLVEILCENTKGTDYRDKGEPFASRVTYHTPEGRLGFAKDVKIESFMGMFTFWVYCSEATIYQSYKDVTAGNIAIKEYLKKIDFQTSN